MAEELKACLRCGCADITDADYGQEYWCQCTVCGLRTKSFSSRIADDMGWNTRAHAPSQGGEAVRLELVENLKYGGMHIRKWENLAGLGAGTHKLYTHPADQVAEPDADKLAQFIRQIDGDNRMGAGALAEHICEWLAKP